MWYRIFLLVAVCHCQSQAQTVWSTGTGTARIAWSPGLLAVGGLSVPADSNGLTSVALSDASAIKFVAPWGSPNSFLGGSLKSEQCLALTCASNRTVTIPMELFAMKDTGMFELRDDEGEPVFALDGFDVRFDPGMHRLVLQRGNLRLTREFAARVGHPELDRFVVGVVGAEVDVHEMDARIARKSKPLPAACKLPPGTNYAVALRAVEAMQFAAQTDRTVRVAVALRFENLGPDAPAFQAVPPLPLSLRVVAVDGVATTEVARVIQAMPVDPPEVCPCPDMSRWYPGFTNRWTLADALAAGLWVELPEDVLTRSEVRLVLEVEIPGSALSVGFRPRRAGGIWVFDL